MLRPSCSHRAHMKDPLDSIHSMDVSGERLILSAAELCISLESGEFFCTHSWCCILAHWLQLRHDDGLLQACHSKVPS